MGLLQNPKGVRTKALPFQTHLIQSPDLGRIAVGDHERRDILHDFGAPPRDCVGADSAKLVNCGKAPDDDMVADFDMSGNGSVIGEDHLVTHLAVVGDMAVGEKVATAADRGARPDCSAAIDGDKFPEGIVVTYLEICGFSGILEILSLLAD